MRRVTSHFWGGIAAVLAAYAGLGFWLSGDGEAEGQLYKWGLTALAIAPLLLMAVYTGTGNRWWRNELGSALAVLSFGISWTAWPLAYTFWFLHGVLTASWLAWIEVSGPALVAVAILWLCSVFARIHRDAKNSRKDAA